MFHSEIGCRECLGTLGTELLIRDRSWGTTREAPKASTVKYGVVSPEFPRIPNFLARLNLAMLAQIFPNRPDIKEMEAWFDDKLGPMAALTDEREDV